MALVTRPNLPRGPGSARSEGRLESRHGGPERADVSGSSPAVFLIGRDGATGESGIQIHDVIGIRTVELGPAGVMIRRKDSAHHSHGTPDGISRTSLIHGNEPVLVSQDEMRTSAQNPVQSVGDAGHQPLGRALGSYPNQDL